jgi:hypothetical protein
MSAPRVAGILATALGKRGKTSPAELSAALVDNAKHAVTGQPGNTTYVDSLFSKDTSLMNSSDLLAQNFA